MSVFRTGFDRDAVRSAIMKARKFTGMLQATMGLECQGVDRVTLRQAKRRMTFRMLGGNTSGK